MTANSLRDQAVALLRDGTSNAEVARHLRVPLGTVSWWKHRDLEKRGELPGRKRSTCPHCYGDQLDTAAYSYLLGLYLGDGHIMWPKQHRVPNLVVTCDDKWPGVMDAAEQAMREVFPNNSPCRVRRTGCHDVKVYSMHLPCLFPQCGPGKKHERLIALAPWQQRIVDEHPWGLIRGLIHSDGCRVTNWATRTVNGVVRRHEYPRYFFTQTSADIRGIFTAALDSVGVEWKASIPRPEGQVNVSVARKASVALMDAHIGPKH
ncbi:helix-turn-helix domain-containing protein [Kitasatospora sp. NBC_00240]|uniref:helix-turn-helix domain-containing protein n=1 Tax=Kitasatospora sp. NBC_00240 TaxID=2903567 RepID=UPI002253657D|nr:helix-turn-helix domain-containing protein [Kitasatospora sp. NBC_00240]MCX5213566.1 helix-turn-helix domain-containing protein [Kitasatospora sp. NBC_00240]